MVSLKTFMWTLASTLQNEHIGSLCVATRLQLLNQTYTSCFSRHISVWFHLKALIVCFRCAFC